MISVEDQLGMNRLMARSTRRRNRVMSCAERVHLGKIGRLYPIPTATGRRGDQAVRTSIIRVGSTSSTWYSGACHAALRPG